MNEIENKKPTEKTNEIMLNKIYKLQQREETDKIHRLSITEMREEKSLQILQILKR